MQRLDVIIIGAGVVGTTIARELSRYHLDILLLDKANDVAVGATKANSAIVHGGYAEKNSTLKAKLCLRGRRKFAELNAELNFGFSEKGSLVVTTEDDPTPLKELMANGIKNGVDDLTLLDKTQVREIEPELTEDIKWALYCRGAGVCSPYEMAIAMAENAIANGVNLVLDNEVLDIKREDNSFLVIGEKGEYKATYVINAAGVYSDQVCGMVGINDFRIIPRSGEYILFVRGSGDPIRHVVFQLPTARGKGVLITSTYYGNLLIGPDASDSADREDTGTHLERVAAIFEQCQRLYPKIDPRQFLRSFSGIRARSSTDDFIIEETKVKGFINVAGIQSPGLTAAPAIAEMVVKILTESGLRQDRKKDFQPYREPVVSNKTFRTATEVKALLQLPPSPKRMICRCEQVTEGEIVDALHRGIKVTSVDGVKRRTRASMGWCQGTFCRPRIVEVMEREYGQSIDPRFDTEHSGVSRVGKSELQDFLLSRRREDD